MSSSSKSDDRRAYAWALGWMALVPAAAIFVSCAPPAHADSVVDRYAAQNAGRVCTVLDRFPTFDGIGGVADAIVNESNLTYRDAGEVVAISVITVCPQHQGLINDYVRAFAPTQSGGRLV